MKVRSTPFPGVSESGPPQRANSIERRILLVDDHPAVLDSLSSILGQMPGLSVVAVRRASEARVALDQAEPDVIVMDVGLPDEDGLQLLSSLLEIHPDAAAVVFSMHDPALLCERALAAGAQAFMSKAEPVTNLVELVVELAATRREAGSSKPC